MADTLEDYQKDYPNLIIDILIFFDSSNANHNNGRLIPRTIIEFCRDSKGSLKYQPPIIDSVCKILCNNNIMSCINNSSRFCLENSYIAFNKAEKKNNEINESLRIYYSSMVYGLQYIYNTFKDFVVPVITVNKDGDYSCGTAFLFWNGIVTAKHCLTDVKHLRIKGFTGKELNNAKIYISENPGLDLAYIDLERSTSQYLLFNEGKILQEVLVMGYPSIPTFTDFLTAEAATISSKAELRLTPTKGNIAAYGHQYLNKVEAMLITAKIRGGNSGGPVINSFGELVGVACQLPDNDRSQGNYDDLGYGIAIPSKYLIDIINDSKTILEKEKDFFEDYS